MKLRYSELIKLNFPPATIYFECSVRQNWTNWKSAVRVGFWQRRVVYYLWFKNRLKRHTHHFHCKSNSITWYKKAANTNGNILTVRCRATIFSKKKKKKKTQFKSIQTLQIKTANFKYESKRSCEPRIYKFLRNKCLSAKV